MHAFHTRLTLAATILLMTACVTIVGTNFERANFSRVTLDKTTKEDATQLFGAPRKQQAFTVNKDLAGKELPNPLFIEEFSYYFHDTQAEAALPHVEPSRSATLQFSGNKLISYRFSSSFKQDSSDFDETLVNKVVKGKTTEQDILNLFGKPSGYSQYPLAKEAGGSRIVYYVFLYEKNGSRKYRMKTFSAYLSPNKIVSDFELNVTQK